MTYKILWISLACSAVFSAHAGTTINAVHRNAYGANIGWLNFRGDVANGAKIGLYFSTGYVWSANAGWISLGSGSPTNGFSITSLIVA